MTQVYLVIGLGETGFSCVRYLCEKKYRVIVADTREAPPKLEACQTQFPDVMIHLGEFSDALLRDVTTAVISPGLSLTLPIIESAMQKNIPVVGDIELFVREAKAPIVAITGSNGKTTLTTLMGELINHAGKSAIVCGNIGTPVLDVLNMPVPDYYVMELSSFQLETTYSLRAKVAVLTNLSPDHMDRYATLQDYLIAKQRIFINCDHAVVNADENNTWKSLIFSDKPVAFTLNKPLADQWGIVENCLAYGEEKYVDIASLHLQERFNQQNFLAALAMGSVLHLSKESMIKTLMHFSGLPHRCQRVPTTDGVFWFNDSKGTNPGAVVAAIESVFHRYHPGKMILIAGGDGKGVDFSILQDVVKSHIETMIVLGKDALLLQKALENETKVVRVQTVREAVAYAKTIAEKNDAVLLSPACSSLDQYKSYVERGKDFVAAVSENI